MATKTPIETPRAKPAAAAVAAVPPIAAAAMRKGVAKPDKPVAAPEQIVETAAEAVVTATAEVAIPASKEPTIMATNFETANTTPAFDAPKVFTDLNDRAKASFEKTQKFAAEFGDFSKGNIEAIVESSKIAAKGLETLGQDAADYTRKSFEGLTATVKSLASVKSPTDFFKVQSDYARSAFDAAVAQSSKSTEAFIKLTSDAAQPISSRFALAVEKVKLAA